MTNFDKIIHLITPGIDSICAYFYLMSVREYTLESYNQVLELVHVPISPRYAKEEVKALKNLERRLYHDINFLAFDNKNIREEKDGFIRSRNLLLASIVDSSTLIGPDEKTLISFSFTSDDRVYDSSVEFCQNVSKTFHNRRTSIDSLVRSLSKLDLAKWFWISYKDMDQVVKRGIFKDTYSCYAGEYVECLECNACFRKSVILCNLDLEIRPTEENFLRTRLNILNEKVPEERKESIRYYVSKLLEQKMVGKDFEKFIK